MSSQQSGAAVCANCGYSRAGVADPKGACPECGLVPTRLPAEKARALCDGVRLVAWSLGGGLVGWFAAVGALTKPAGAGAERWWILLIPTAMCGVALWWIAGAMGQGRAGRRCLWAAAVLVVIQFEHATAWSSYVLGLFEQFGLSSPLIYQLQYEAWDAACCGVVMWGAIVGGQVMSRAASVAGLVRLSLIVRRVGFWFVVATGVATLAKLALWVSSVVFLSSDRSVWPSWTVDVPICLDTIAMICTESWKLAVVGGFAASLACYLKLRPSGYDATAMRTG